MKAVVPLRPSPHRVLAEDGRAEPYRWGLSIDDRVALAAALESAGETIAVGIGGDSARNAVRSGLAAGADRGVHVDFDPIDEVVADKYASVLARVAEREGADAVFLGDDAPLMGTETVGLTAASLEWPSASGVTALGDAGAVDAGFDPATTFEAGELPVRRKLAVGRQEVLGVSLPVVLGIDSGYANPERADLATAVAGQRADIESPALADVAPDESRFSMSVGRTTVEGVTPNERWGRGDPPRGGTVEARIRRMLGRDAEDGGGSGEVIEVPPEEAAERVVEYLQAEDLL